ncbi:MAG TPA: glycoside hydrolase family 172 protein [Tepidisphaeraceae bacterium]|jgi:hypothetical protein
MNPTIVCLAATLALFVGCAAQQSGRTHSGAGAGGGGGDGPLASLAQWTDVRSRAVTPENFTGEKGKAAAATQGTGAHAAEQPGMGRGWKISPSVRIKAHSTFTLADIKGPGCITHIWMTPTGNWRRSIIRFYWDGQEQPSVEAPVGDFFACGLKQYAPVSSLAVCVNPGSAFNCYWSMPFRKQARITLENIDDKDMVLYYQVDYSEGAKAVANHALYFHAQFRMEDPVKARPGLYTLLEGVKGRGQFVGTYMTYMTHRAGWWGEGEIKFYLDGDGEFPTITSTGTEDYFCGSYNFENRATKLYQVFSTPYAGLIQVIPPEKAYLPEQKFGLYRWHVTDPIRFEKDLRVEIQDLGWEERGKYKKLEDSISTVSYWYQTLPTAAFPQLPAREQLDPAGAPTSRPASGPARRASTRPATTR